MSEFELWLFSGDPERMRWLLINTEPLFDEGATEPTAVLIAFVDITAQKRA